MPTYDYVCDSCEHSLEVFQSFKEAPKKKCPQCGTLSLRRVISGGIGLVFKGSGFYITDNRGSTTATDAKSNATSASSGDAKKPDNTSSTSEKKAAPSDKTASTASAQAA